MTEITIAAPTIDGDGNSHYAPCRIGLHFCGSTPDGEQPYTAANILATSYGNAWAIFAAARSVGECGKDEADFCCDLMINDDVADDFWTNRQLVPAIASEIERLNTHPTPDSRTTDGEASYG